MKINKFDKYYYLFYNIYQKMINQKTKYNQRIINMQYLKNIVSYQKDKNKYDNWCIKKNNLTKLSQSNLFQITTFYVK